MPIKPQFHKFMKRLLSTGFLSLVTVAAFAQQSQEAFCGRMDNDEYEVYLHINFQKQDITIPGQEIYGSLPGYLGKKNNSFCWPITTVKKHGEHEMLLTMVNDYGSEDLTATLSLQRDSTYVLKQVSGSTIKVPKNGKWQKLPKTLVFQRAR